MRRSSFVISGLLFLSTFACSSVAVETVEQTDAALRADGGADGGADAAPADGGTDFVDPRDGKKYPTIRLGAQTWLAKNLAWESPSGSSCYDDDPAACAADGRLYTWAVAPTVCPEGWRLGTDDDWKALETVLGMAANQLDLEGYETLRGTNEGLALKDPAGFAAVPAGFRSGTSFQARGDRTYFWTASTRGSDVWRRRVGIHDATIFRFTNPPTGFAISVRCVTDDFPVTRNCYAVDPAAPCAIGNGDGG